MLRPIVSYDRFLRAAPDALVCLRNIDLLDLFWSFGIIDPTQVQVNTGKEPT